MLNKAAAATTDEYLKDARRSVSYAFLNDFSDIVQFSKTTEYALQVLLHLAHTSEALHTSSGLHKALHIPKKYLQQLLTDLSKKGLVISVQGKYGGFKLAKPSSEIFVYDVISAVEGVTENFTCIFGLGDCARRDPCPVHESWQQAQAAIFGIMRSTRLSDISEK